MKNAVRFRAALCLAAALWTATGCGAISISSSLYAGGPHYPQSDPAQIQILRASPTRPHVRLGEVTVTPSRSSASQERIEAGLRIAAAELGADAVVIIYNQAQIPPTARGVTVGVAIKYP